MRLCVLISFLLLIAGTPRTVEACVCAGTYLTDREEAAREFADAAIVFEGEVLAGGREIQAPTRGEPGLATIVFRVMRSYKGNIGDSIELYDASAGWDCSPGVLPIGGKWFVYGLRGKDGRIYWGTCGRTRGLDFAGPDIRYARGEPPTKEDLTPPGERERLGNDPSLATQGATLTGTVRRAHGGDASNALVTVWKLDEAGRRANFIAATQKVSANGSYEIRLVPPGGYAVTALDGLKFVGEYGNVSLKENQTSSGVDVVLRPRALARVKIRVVAPPELHDKVFVWLRDVEMDSVKGESYPYADTAHLDDKNFACFNFVPLGLYNVDVLLDGDDLTKPSWTHDDLQVRVKRRHVEATIELRKATKGH